MKTYRVFSTTQLREHLDSHEQRFGPSDVQIKFSDLVSAIGLTRPEPIMIWCQGYNFLCPESIVSNAWEREKALAKHSEHYRTGVMFVPTMISLSQCLRFPPDKQYVLTQESLDDH
jgi:hypothetical protein